jgi:hypothetical protein
MSHRIPVDNSIESFIFHWLRDRQVVDEPCAIHRQVLRGEIDDGNDSQRLIGSRDVLTRDLVESTKHWLDLSHVVYDSIGTFNMPQSFKH